MRYGRNQFGLPQLKFCRPPSWMGVWHPPFLVGEATKKASQD